ncbi:hypothetical protein Pse7367_1001 [Thalassoporum mexicanum PCC 7367]|uniref:hypothetical protein n=1 Tax=Thalassoporum mexicanum TaxID=3457544 RepID=UPI00029FD133|nr:hypothetical protein [Pseudanabaena sp. PCC 7367]AFY69300.1 hypothetical protein Pse7367_1001 [Pseudanabaena sp. PCC 7367]
MEENNDSIQLPIELKNPKGDKVLMKLTPEADPDGLISRLNMEKIPSDDSLNRILGTIPSVASAFALSQSFRIIMPAGVLGNLMHLVKDPAMSGLLTTSVVGSSGGIVATAGLASMTGFVAPLVVWTILAFLTGQFFLSHIERNTRAIFEQLQKILFFLVAREESDLRARIEFLRYVSDNFRALRENSEMRIATLTNLQKVNTESLASLKLWTYNIQNELSDITQSIDFVKSKKKIRDNVGKVADSIEETRRHTNRAVASWQCYCLGIALEIQLGYMFDLSLLTYTKKNLSRQSKDLKTELQKAENIWNDLKNISYFNESNKFKAGELHAVGVELAEFSTRIDNSIVSTKQYIDSLENLEKNGANLLYYNKSFYRPTQGAIPSGKDKI